MKSIPETRLTAFSIGRVTVDSIVSGETLLYATVTLTTGGANDGKSAIARRGAANRPSTTIASESIATATRRRTANPAIPTVRSYASAVQLSSSGTLGVVLRDHAVCDPEAFRGDRNAGVDARLQQNLDDLVLADTVVERAAH